MSKLEDKIAGRLDQWGVQYEREFKFHPTRRWRFDFVITDKRLIRGRNLLPVERTINEREKDT